MELEKDFLNKFEARVVEAVNSSNSFSSKIQKLSWLLQSESSYWNQKGNDRILSALTTFCGEAVENCVKSEINGIRSRHQDREIRERLLNKIKSESEKISWLPSGFKSSINLELSFARTV